MKVFQSKANTNQLALAIAPTGGALDPVPDSIGGVTHLPYVGGYRVDWGDGNTSVLVPPRTGVPPADVPDPDHYVNATHTYTQFGSFRGYVEGDARVRFHVIAS